jgi:hypothetical protein
MKAIMTSCLLFFLGGFLLGEPPTLRGASAKPADTTKPAAADTTKPAEKAPAKKKGHKKAAPKKEATPKSEESPGETGYTTERDPCKKNPKLPGCSG